MIGVRLTSFYMANKNFVLAFLAAVIVIILISSAILIIPFDFKSEEAPIPIDEEEIVIDDRISPYLNQGLIVELNRIRNRGIIDALFSRGKGWETPPSFHFVVEMDDVTVDGMEYFSEPVYFNTWDTMLYENKLFKKPAEEQSTSTVTITIMEHVSSGLLGRRTSYEAKESFTITYDYRTGRWSGDDSFKDVDGYGHYRGTNYDIWFNIYQTDYDHDYIPYWTEVNILHTDPQIDDSELDPDNDGIPTTWEWRWGYDPFTYDNHSLLDPDIDGIENIEEYQMQDYFADPFIQDSYLEVDGMEANGIFGKENMIAEETKQAVIERYASHNINYYIDDGWPDGPVNGGGELLTYYDRLDQDSGQTLQFYNHHFSDDRKGIFRYLIVAHSAGFNYPSSFNRYDTLTVPDSNLFYVKICFSFTEKNDRIMSTSLILHELGHSMGISPWSHQGCDNYSFVSILHKYLGLAKEYDEIWGNYLSVMNYYHIYNRDLMDYSDGSHGEGDQNDWVSLYMPTFQIEAQVIEEVYFEVPGTQVLVNESDEFVISEPGWEFNSTLSSQAEMLFSNDDQRIIGTDLLFKVAVYNSSDSVDGIQHIRIYAKPETGSTYSTYTLSYEGTIDTNSTLNFYDQQGLIDAIYNELNL